MDRKYRGAKVVGNALSKSSRYDLYLHLGDMSYADGDQPEWDKYGEQMEKYAAMLPGAAAVGNHERDNNGKRGSTKAAAHHLRRSSRLCEANHAHHAAAAPIRVSVSQK